MHQITEAQLRLARLIAEGLTNDEIAVRLNISSRKVKADTDKLRWMLDVPKKRHIPRVMRELGLLRDE